MTYAQMLNAYFALPVIKKARLPYVKARAIYEVSKSIEIEYAFFAEEEKKLIACYAEKDKNNQPKIKDGKVLFSDTSTKHQYEESLKQLLNTEITASIAPIKLGQDDFSDPISADTIASLDTIIQFE